MVIDKPLLACAALGIVGGASAGSAIGALFDTNTPQTADGPGFSWGHSFQHAPITASVGGIAGAGLALALLHHVPAAARGAAVLSTARWGAAGFAISTVVGAAACFYGYHGESTTTKLLRGGLGISMVAAPIFGVARLMTRIR